MDFNTVSWKVSFGVNQGYDLDSQKDVGMAAFNAVFHRVMETIAADTGIYVTGVVTSSRTVYSQQWGCPAEGEITYTVQGSCNPEFAKVDDYLPALYAWVDAMRKELKQSTALVEVVPTMVRYFHD